MAGQVSIWQMCSIIICQPVNTRDFNKGDQQGSVYTQFIYAVNKDCFGPSWACSLTDKTLQHLTNYTEQSSENNHRLHSNYTYTPSSPRNKRSQGKDHLDVRGTQILAAPSTITYQVNIFSVIMLILYTTP
ncbi:hypothetical protein SK128_025129 [Halocaridina rubra]|uniref:Uncharacterized protein n=1 Tax=Halocaridina rubra TaxID=373956 RepID=A0AAN8WXV5_HALRR